MSALFLVAAALIYFGNIPFTDNKLYCSSFLFVPLVLGLSIYPWPIIVNRTTEFIGRISFSVYLLHFFALILLVKLKNHFVSSSLANKRVDNHVVGLVTFVILTMSLTLPVAALTWKFIEVPGMAFGRLAIKRLMAHEQKTRALNNA